MFVDVDGESVEIPRLLKRDGARLTVTTEEGLRAALAAGWVLRVGQVVSSRVSTHAVEAALDEGSTWDGMVPIETTGDPVSAVDVPQDATSYIDTLPDVADVPEPDAPRRGGKGGKKR